MQVDTSTLQRLPLLGHLPVELLRSADKWLAAKRYDAGQVVIHQGVRSEGIYIALQGQLRVTSLDKDDNEHDLLYLSERSFFGELSVLDDIPSSASVITVTECWILLIPRNIVTQLIDQNTGFAKEIMIRMSRALRSTTARVRMLRARSEWRVYYFLRSIGRHENGKMIGKMPTHAAIASMTNLSRETVTRSLKSLQSRRLIALGKIREEKAFVIEPAIADEARSSHPASC